MNQETIKKDAIEIVRRLIERNPEFFELIKDGGMSLEDFTEIVITQHRAFNPSTYNGPMKYFGPKLDMRINGGYPN